MRKFAAQGSNIAINYANNEGPAQQLAQELRSSYNVNIAIIQADASSTSQVKDCVQTAISALGGLDIIIANAGWTRFADFADLDALSDEEWDKCWRTHVLGIKHLVSSSMPTFQANTEGGVVLVTSSIAGRNLNGSSLAYSVTKAAQLHLVKCIAKTQGAKLRANAVLPGLLLTEWGQQFGKEKIEVLQREAVLKQEVCHKSSWVKGKKNTTDSSFSFLDQYPRLCRHVCFSCQEY